MDVVEIIELYFFTPERLHFFILSLDNYSPIMENYDPVFQLLTGYNPS
jgi:hypothetical protein